jgi:hypothetical protein
MDLMQAEAVAALIGRHERRRFVKWRDLSCREVSRDT